MHSAVTVTGSSGQGSLASPAPLGVQLERALKWTQGPLLLLGWDGQHPAGSASAFRG